MKSFRPKWHLLQHDHALFSLYRWLAWGYAGVMLVLTSPGTAENGRLAWLLVVAAALNIVATLLARPYVRIARRRPWVLGIDMLLGVALLSLSQGAYLVFMPYALAALVLPGLLLTWRAALLAAMAFVFLEQLARFSTSRPEQSTMATMLPQMLLLLLAFAFVLSWASVARLRHRHAGSGAATTRQPQLNSLAEHRGRSASSSIGFQSFAAPGIMQQEPHPPHKRVEAAVESYRSPVQRDLQDVGRTICSMPRSAAIDLATALEQLVTSFQRHNDIQVEIHYEGTSRPLGDAQYTLLVKLAQETLLNIQQHAHAHSASLTLRYEPRTVMLVIQDDGVGLLDGTHERPGLHSLRAMNYRLLEFDGQLQVFEGESGGVTVRGVLPLN